MKKKEEGFRAPSESEKQQLDYIIEEVLNKRICFKNDKSKELTNVCTSIAHSYGEAGRSFFLSLCEGNNDLLPYEKENLYSDCLKSKWGKYSTIYSLFNMVEKHGIEVPEPLDSFTQPEPLSDDVYEALPTFLKKISHSVESKRERDIFLLSALTVLSGCFPMVKFSYRGFEYYANLFTFIIAPPGSGKSIINFAKILAERIHAKKLAQTKKEWEIYKSMKKKERENEETPKHKMLFIPANISAASIIQTLNENESNGIIFETEADTLIGTIMKEWGVSSELIRNSFQHEEVSYRRKLNDEYIVITKPSLAILLSGTPNQLEKLITHIENGLFSRFLFYFFNDKAKFNNDLDDNYKEFSKKIKNASIRIYYLFLHFEKMKCQIEFKVTDTQRIAHQEIFDYMNEETTESMGNGFSAVVKRLGLIVYRVAMIFTILKYIDSKEKPEKTLICDDAEFYLSMYLVKSLLEQSISVFNHLTLSSTKYSQLKYKFYKLLPERFTRGNADELAIYLNLNLKTAESYLERFIKDNKIGRHKGGSYFKMKF